MTKKTKQKKRVLDQWKGIYGYMQNLVGRRKEEKKKAESEWDWTCTWGMEELKQLPTSEQYYGTEERHLKLLKNKAADL